MPKVTIVKDSPTTKHVVVVPISNKKCVIKDQAKYLKQLDLDVFSGSNLIKIDSKQSLFFVDFPKKDEQVDTDIKKLGFSISSSIKKFDTVVFENFDELLSFLSTAASASEDYVRGDALISSPQERAMELLLYGIYFGAYEFDNYLTEKAEIAKKFLLVTSTLDVGCKNVVKKMTNYSKALWFERDLVNVSPSTSTPKWCSDHSATFLKEAGFSAQILEAPALKQKKYEGIIAVGKGSSQPPSYLIAKYKHKSAKKHVVLIGKGVTFDTGGVNIKPDGGKNMKGDMSGASTVVALGAYLAMNKEKVNLTLYVPFVENHINGLAYRPDDIIEYKNGLSVEVHNTDAEGRMILADALIDGSKAKPDLIIDMATLTGASHVAVGGEASTFYTNRKEMAKRVNESSATSTELSVELPLIKSYNALLKTDHADVKHTGGRYGGSITAALFLQKFVDKDIPWVHFDLSSAFQASSSGIHKAGATGEGLLLGSKLIESL